MTIYPLSVWWQNLQNLDYWVKERGANVLDYQNAISFAKGDFLALHVKVEQLRNEGYPVSVMRSPAYKFVNDPQPVSFDIQWQHHLLAFGLDDEFEDKVPGTNNVWGNQQPIIDYVKSEVAAYKAWMPNIPIYANFNGTHIQDPALDGGKSKQLYTACINAGLDFVSSDNYPICNQQVRADGTFLYPDPVAAIVNGTRLLKSWTTKPVWTYLETCNQETHKANDPGWTSDFKFVGSRAPTVNEIWQMLYYHLQLNGNGIGYFPQAYEGKINDATPQELVPVLKQIGLRMNPPDPLNGAGITIAGKSYKLLAQ